MSRTSGQEPDSPERDNERGLRAGNVFLLLAAAGFIAVSLWLVDAMIAARKADDCISAGRRNCTPVSVPPRER